MAEDRTNMPELLQDSASYEAKPVRERTKSRIAQAAAVYLAAWKDPKTRHRPTMAVAEHFTISASAAGKLVSRARAEGLLPATRAGVALGGPTTRPRRKS
jgi:hypothetical protein